MSVTVKSQVPSRLQDVFHCAASSRSSFEQPPAPEFHPKKKKSHLPPQISSLSILLFLRWLPNPSPSIPLRPPLKRRFPMMFTQPRFSFASPLELRNVSSKGGTPQEVPLQIPFRGRFIVPRARLHPLFPRCEAPLSFLTPFPLWFPNVAHLAIHFFPGSFFFKRPQYLGSPFPVGTF